LRSVVFVDLDSTLADTRHRQHMIEDARAAGREPDWEAYSLACAGDEPIPGTIQLVRMLTWEGYHIVILSGRSEAAMYRTNEWLYRNQVPFNELILRPKAVSYAMSPEEFKIAAIEAWIDRNPDHDDPAGGPVRPTLIVEDWPPAADAMKERGWKVLLVNPDYDRSGMKV
jgi:FMN phosphatase YigB (HAD superfamily)